MSRNILYVGVNNNNNNKLEVEITNHMWFSFHFYLVSRLHAATKTATAATYYIQFPLYVGKSSLILSPMQSAISISTSASRLLISQTDDRGNGTSLLIINVLFS